MIKIYTMPSCPDCASVKLQVKGNPNFEVIDISSDVHFLKEFLQLRDNNPAFKPVKERGAIGIPCFVKEDGSITFNPEDVGLTRKRVTKETCSVKGGC